MPLDFQLEDGEFICEKCGQLYVPGVATLECPHDLTLELMQIVHDIRSLRHLPLVQRQAMDILRQCQF